MINLQNGRAENCHLKNPVRQGKARHILARKDASRLGSEVREDWKNSVVREAWRREREERSERLTKSLEQDLAEVLRPAPGQQ